MSAANQTMKHKLSAILAFVSFSVFHAQFSTALAQGTAFTYQGQLNASGDWSLDDFYTRTANRVSNAGPQYDGNTWGFRTVRGH
jgi:hypothetical protein